ncbi:MAG: hypothetical protein EA412_05005 [Chitinophagaceae bacterium]|nr:MAG: hypothetical protein EA412_05005 [Chitinophagaceae bacterium]
MGTQKQNTNLPADNFDKKTDKPKTEPDKKPEIEDVPYIGEPNPKVKKEDKSRPIRGNEDLNENQNDSVDSDKGKSKQPLKDINDDNKKNIKKTNQDINNDDLSNLDMVYLPL